MDFDLHNDDTMTVLEGIPEESLDALVTDPPSGIHFMGREWDDHKKYKPCTTKGRLALRVSKWLNLESWEAGFLAFSVDWAVKAYRVLKPGSHGLVWGLPRSSDLTMLALRIAGFEVRDVIENLVAKSDVMKRFVESLSTDQIQALAHAIEDNSRVLHVFGSGFPKSYDVSKGIDKMLGAERTKDKVPIKDINMHAHQVSSALDKDNPDERVSKAEKKGFHEVKSDEPVTDEAKMWHGWATALKPANEPWIMVRKPMSETVAQSLLDRGTGALNIANCRTKAGEDYAKMDMPYVNFKSTEYGFALGVNDEPPEYSEERFKPNPAGRWPTNLVMEHRDECRSDDCVLRWECEDCGVRVWVRPLKHCPRCEGEWRETDPCPVAEIANQSGPSKSTPTTGERYGVNAFKGFSAPNVPRGYSDEGTAARYFPRFHRDPDGEASFSYEPKTSPTERNLGMPKGKKNKHPTIKSIALMRWLIRLITPPGGTVIDPFMGSGTTGMAAAKEGVSFVGIERDPDSFETARHRVRYMYARER